MNQSAVKEWIDLRNESSLDMKVDGRIDLLFSDSDMPIREQEVRRYLPQVNPYGLILMHDASSHLSQVREAALKLEREGLISVVLLPTPRGLVVAQKREGRSSSDRPQRSAAVASTHPARIAPRPKARGDSPEIS